MTETPLISREFPQEDELVYLNHAAVSPWPSRTSKAVSDFAHENSVTGAENYKKWSAREKRLRDTLAGLINAPSSEDIALLKNTSEAISVVACGIKWNEGDNVVSSDEEFPSNRIPWDAQKKHGVELREISLGVEDPEQSLIDACDNQTRVMSVSSVQYGSGFKLDLIKLGQFCRQRQILFCVDAIQSIGAHQFDVQAVQADFAMADAHKWMLGPEGIAVFYCRKEVRESLELHQFGWHMVEHAGDYDRRDWYPASSARRFECGSPNMLGTFALGASLELIKEVGIAHIEREINDRVRYIIEQLQAMPGMELLSETESHRLAGIVTFRPAAVDVKKLHLELMKKRVICANRCGGIRFSPHFYTPSEKIDRGIALLSSLL